MINYDSMTRGILYLGMEIAGKPRTGGEATQLRNRKMLRAIFNEVEEMEIPKVGLLAHIKNVILGRGYGYTTQMKSIIDNTLKKQYDVVFVDSSAYGTYVKYFRDKGLKTIVFCHNVEYDFYKSKLQSKKSLMNYVLVRYIHRQEQLSIHNATKIISLNERDNKGLLSYYGRGADLILPLFYEDEELPQQQGMEVDNSKYLLFVGGDFFANTDGIVWFIKKVTPFIRIEIRIAGGCCDSVRKRLDLEQYPNVKLLGFVDDLDKVYIQASGVICPIFSGSGMKTKTIEALRYGKTIFGTTEAFEGITVDFNEIGGLCNTAEEFIEDINNANLNLFNKVSYEFYLNNFTATSVYPKFANLVDNL